MWERQIYPHIENKTTQRVPEKHLRAGGRIASGGGDWKVMRRGTSSSVWAKQITRLQTAPAPDRSVQVTGLCNQTDQPSSQLHPLTFTQLLARRARRGLSDTYCTDTVINCRHLVYRLVASLVSTLMSCSRRPYYPRHLRAHSNCAKMCFCNKFQIFCEQIYLESYFRTCG